MQPLGYWRDFMAGPGSWTLSRLVHFRHVVACGESGMAWEWLNNPLYSSLRLVVPEDAASLLSGPPDSLRTLSTDNSRFADAVATCLMLASIALAECYLADQEGSEVYLLHHHDMVVASVPVFQTREEMVRELNEATDVFTDASGSGYPIDDEEDDAAENERS
jgi:hypothetical protein